MMYAVWLVVGLVAGFVASLVGRQSRSSMLINMIVGVIGSLVGGVALVRDNLNDAHSMSFFRFGSLLTAVAGAAILLLIFNLVRRGTNH